MHDRIPLAASLAATLVLAGAAPGLAAEPVPATTMYDVSGLIPFGEGHAIALHDAKHPDEDERPRASLLTLPVDPVGVLWEPLTIEWLDPTRPASDLESGSGIPGSDLVLLAESGDDASEYQRLFLADVDPQAAAGPTATIVAETEWPGGAFNVEGVAVGRAGDGLVLLWAERAEGQPTTTIEVAPLTLEPFDVGRPRGADFTSPAVQGDDDRPVSAMEVGPDGLIHVASAYDSGADFGPYASSVWTIGQLGADDDGPLAELLDEPVELAVADGYKVESLAVLQGQGDGPALWLGTDDEDYGGTIRPLPTE